MLWPERKQERLYWWGWSAHGQCGAKADRVAVARAPAELTAPGPLRDAAASAFDSVVVDHGGGVWHCGKGVATKDKPVAPVKIPLSVKALRVAAGRGFAAAALVDGRVACWGANERQQCGVAEPKVALVAQPAFPAVDGVVEVACGAAFVVVVRADGSVYTWGAPSFAASRIWGKAFEATREGVTAIFTTGTAYAALKRDGSVWCWGNPSAGGEPAIARPNHALESYELESVASHLRAGVRTVVGNTGGAFAAVKDDGSVVCWGAAEFGGDSSSVTFPHPVAAISATAGAFAALTVEGSVVTWGDVTMGGAPGVVVALPNPGGWWKVRRDGERTVRSARRTHIALAAPGAAPAPPGAAPAPTRKRPGAGGAAPRPAQRPRLVSRGGNDDDDKDARIAELEAALAQAQQAPVAPPAAAALASVTGRLRELASLRASGALTEAEFARAKAIELG